MIALALVLAASDCGGCHAVAHAQWAQSRHASSATNPLYVASRDKHPRRLWCASCHVPEGDSVGCTSCHKPEAGHGAKVEVSVCASCHEFVEPKTHAPMQTTVSEWEKAAAAPCSACHDHAARSGHDAQSVREALRIEVKRRNGVVLATVSAPGAGHAIPTGDPFRRLMLTAGDCKKRVVVPPGQTVVLELGPTPAARWELTYLHAEPDIAEADHPLWITGGAIE